VNLYSLFVERAAKPGECAGIVGLLTPPGCFGQGSSTFFKSIATTGRLAALLDSRTRKFSSRTSTQVSSSAPWCSAGPSVPSSKRVAPFYSMAWRNRRSTAFFQLERGGFRRRQSQHRHAPIFRYRGTPRSPGPFTVVGPVLVDGAPSRPSKSGRCVMHHVPHDNDSHRFKRRDELEGGGILSGERPSVAQGEGGVCAVVTKGKWCRAYDHRAASVVVNPANLHRPAQPEPVGLMQHQDENWLPEPQFWIDRQQIETPSSIQWTLAFKDVTPPTICAP